MADHSLLVENIYAALPNALIPWYKENKRDLPWRGTKNPYHIWLSEIMLQQTRVEAVKGYYSRFLEKLPTVEALANADDEALHKLWEGLGYYNRVRNLKKAAQVIVTQYNGVFPGEYDRILALPGIGAYTAGAIASIAFNLPTPAVDGNVLRVVSRLAADHTPIDRPAYKKEVSCMLADIYPTDASDFTQALMELGATICGPNRKPDCENCPCRSFCVGHKTGLAEQLPVKSPKPEKKVQDMTVLILSCEGRYALEKRPETGLLAGLWQFPNLPGKRDAEQVITDLSSRGFIPAEIHRQVDRYHIFTHICWQMRGIYLELKEIPKEYEWFTAEEINRKIALPTAFRQFWEEIENV